MTAGILLPQVKVLSRARSAGTLSSGGSVTSGLQRGEGHARVRGVFFANNAPAAGFPRVRQSRDGTNFTISQVIPRDVTQSGFTYPIDILLREPYFIVEWTQGGSDATSFEANVFMLPADQAASNPSDTPGGNSEPLELLRSDKDSHFTGSIAVGQSEAENIAGLSASKGRIRSVTILSEGNLDWLVSFFSTDGFGDSDLDSDSFLGSVLLYGADAVALSDDVSTTYRYFAGGLAIPYQDEDDSGELHVRITAVDGAKTAGSSGELVLRVGYAPIVE